MPGSKKPAGRPSGASQTSLEDEVRQALRSVLHDVSASAAAKASAGRTLLEWFGGGKGESGRGRRATELTMDELNDEIARLTSLKE